LARKARISKNLHRANIEQSDRKILLRFPSGQEVHYAKLTAFMTDGRQVTYPQNWKAYDAAQSREEALFMKLLADLCTFIEQPVYNFGRPKLPIQDMVFISALKVYSTKSYRRASGLIDKAIMEGYIEERCAYSSISYFMRLATLTPLLQKLIEISSLPIASSGIEQKFAVDSTGFSSSRYGRYFSFKHGRNLEVKDWVKAHVCSGVNTKIVTAAEVTGYEIADSPVFKSLIEETAKRFELLEVSADKAYSSRKNLQLVEDLGGKAFIPFRSNASGRSKGAPAWKEAYYMFMHNRDAFLKHYHRRSNAETVFHMIKAKFGSNIRSKNKIAQINEVLLKILCHNICVVIQAMHELGIDPNFATQQELSK
jgi:transposase